jgi:hypothetical protein
MARKIKTTYASTVLDEIDQILEQSKYYQSRESGKRFYDQRNFPSVLTSYVAQSGQPIKANAQKFGMSPDTLKKLMSGGPLSENMLFRVRSALVAEAGSLEKDSVFPGDWCDATPRKVTTVISEVSDKLIFLKRVVEGSNFLSSRNAPIDKIQVAQLIALLTETLAALRAPLVDKKRTSGFFRWLGKLARVSAEKGVEKIVVDAMGDAANAGADLIHHLSGHPGVTDLGNIIT